MAANVEIRRAVGADAPILARLLHDFNRELDEATPGVPALTGHVRALLENGEATALLADPHALCRPQADEVHGGHGGGGGDHGAAGLALIRFRTSVWTGRPEAHLQELYVVPGRRGRGIGRALLEATLDAARAAGATVIDLGTGATDTAARSLYESAGFVNREGGPDGPSMLYYEREL
ncbi:MAG: GNAT family N-acetyltransferase [Solirubrobacterales bacterium]